MHRLRLPRLHRGAATAARPKASGEESSASRYAGMAFFSAIVRLE